LEIKKEKIAVVVPVYYGEKSLPELVHRLDSVFIQLRVDYEIILVNDASPDNSWTIIQQLHSQNQKIVGLNFSRNFGQHYSIVAGLKEVCADWIVVMDCDLQDVPEEIIPLYTKAKEGFEVVLARRLKRQDDFLKRFFSKLFYTLLSYFSGIKYDPSIANFGIYKNTVIKEIVNLPEKNKYFPTMVKWVGFSQIAIPVNHADRKYGETSYNFKKLFNLSLDIVLSYSDKPLRLAIKLGMLITFTSIIFTLYQIYRWCANEIEVLGYASIIISIWFLSGIIIFIFGIIGLYVGKIFENVKDRPTYIVKEKIGH
jgi:polyisoprenyl-phosphate glycosyltransferase